MRVIKALCSALQWEVSFTLIWFSPLLLASVVAVTLFKKFHDFIFQ